MSNIQEKIYIFAPAGIREPLQSEWFVCQGGDHYLEKVRRINFLLRAVYRGKGQQKSDLKRNGFSLEWPKEREQDFRTLMLVACNKEGSFLAKGERLVLRMVRHFDRGSLQDQGEDVFKKAIGALTIL
jgi:hypothetical protein